MPSYWYFVTGICSLAGAFGGAYFGQLLARSAEGKRSAKRDVALLRALIAEVQHCADLAATYQDSNRKAPAYRLHYRVYDSALPTLAGSCLLKEDVSALIGFYSHVDQMNWGLEEVDRIKKLQLTPGGLSREAAEALGKEAGRLDSKARDMRSPESKFFTPAMKALSDRLNARTRDSE
jgi:hypothetical protein